jgi:peptidoglycan/LPS O-acetylase OafA/YrhL
MNMRVQSRNNFDLWRLMLATMVVLAHVGSLSQIGVFVNLDNIFNADFAVKSFFSISGYLITKSYMSTSSKKLFFEKRIRRIYPAYILAVLFSFVLGLSTVKLPLSEVIFSHNSVKYLVSNLLFMNFLSPTLPTALEGNVVNAFNGSLWTLKNEMVFYLLTPGMIFLFRRYNAIVVTILLSLISMAWFIYFHYYYAAASGPEIARQFPGQLSYYVIGSLLALCCYDHKIILVIALISLIGFLGIQNEVVKSMLMPLTYTTITIYMCVYAFPQIKIDKIGDLSYGIYLYHFPLIQIMVFNGLFNYNPWAALALLLLILYAISTISWRYIERPLLRRNVKASVV